MLHPLRQKRLELGWSQYHLAFLTGVPQVKISYAERGYPSLTTKEKRLIAEALSESEEQLFPNHENR
jgi:transcriptional regulator with XRE-family HTH domain